MNKIYTLTLASLLAAELSTSVGAAPPPPPPPPPGSSGPVVASAETCGAPLIKKRAEKLKREGLLDLGEEAETRKLVIDYLAGTVDDAALAAYIARAEAERQARAAAKVKTTGKSMLGGAGQEEIDAALRKRRSAASENSEE